MAKKNKISIYEDMTKAEKKVADFLKGIGILWSFEQPIYVKDDKDRPRVWTPDFYLPGLGIHIEVCGANRKCYSYRKKVFDNNKIPVVFVHAYKENEWQDFLINEIGRIHKERWELIKNL